MKTDIDPTRHERLLAKALVQAGVEKQPGETVSLRADQIARLEAEGCFETVGRGREKAG